MTRKILFRASYDGVRVRATQASKAEIESLAGPLNVMGPVEDILELWSLIAIRYPTAIKIHALGWRMILANTWITSAVRVVNLTEGMIQTSSDKIYALGARDKPELDPELRQHLSYTLTIWGFKDVSP